MSYISKYDTKFITFINRRYKRYKVSFTYFDDYILWLFYKLCKCDEKYYYSKLEKDIWDFSDWQTGSPRENESKNDDWKKLEKDPCHLYDSKQLYLDLLKRKNWNEKN